jgi:hypothetical protein
MGKEYLLQIQAERRINPAALLRKRGIIGRIVEFLNQRIEP